MGRLLTGHESRARVVAIAAAMFAVIFAARLVNGETGNGITFLYVLPVVFVGIELGDWAGAGAGLLALALFGVWTAIENPGVGILAYASRGVAFVLVGVVTGQMANRLRIALRESKTAARHFEVARDLLCTIGFDGRMQSVNDSWTHVLGWSKEELLGRPVLDFVHPDDREATEEAAVSATSAGASPSFTNRVRAKDGEWRALEWTALTDTDARVIYAAVRDVTERQAAEHAQREAEERFRRAFEDSAIGMALVGPEDNMILGANRSLARILGQASSDLVGKVSLSELAHADDVPTIAKGMKRLQDGDAPLFRSELRVLRADGHAVWVDLTASMVRDEDGNPLYRLSQLIDIDARRRAEEQLRYLADHDPLSGVYNRRRFEQELQRELGYGAMQRSQGAVMLLDVDKFKEINDTLGHAAGDQVIARIGSTLIERLRSGDVIGRLGGDEFAVLLRRVDTAQAEEVARSVREVAIEQLADVAEGEIETITLSVGVAAFGDGYVPSMDELFRTADAAMYEAKRAGGNQVAVAS